MDTLTTLARLRPTQNISFIGGCLETAANATWDSQTTYTAEQAVNLPKRNLIWNEEAQLYTMAPFTIPTQQECEDYWNSTLKNELALEYLRKKRNWLIKQTDIYSLPDFPFDSQLEKQSWLDYRKALRELPSKTTDPTNPVWPTPPTPIELPPR